MAALLRLAMFSGFVLGDDPAYGDLVHRVLSEGYPTVLGRDTFAARPLLIAPIAASIRLLGWNEFAFVLPVLLASLVGVASVYVIATVIGGRLTGIISSLILVLFPLDLIYATTMTNDIIVSAVASAGAALALLAFTEVFSRVRWRPAVAALGGTMIGLTTAVKLSSVLFAVPLAVTALAAIRRGRRDRIQVLLLLVGWSIGLAVVALFFRYVTGDWLAHVRAELAFNRAYMMPANLDRTAAVLAYVRWSFMLQPVGPINEQFFPYGLLFIFAAAAVGMQLYSNPRRSWIPCVWFVGLFLLFSLWPLQLFPTYVPIHRLPRVLHPAGIPAAILVGASLADLARGRPWQRAAFALAALAYIGVSLNVSLVAWRRHHDVMSDQRVVADVASHYPGTIVADDELLNFLRFRAGYQHLDRFLPVNRDPSKNPPRSLIVVGGSRRIDLDSGYALNAQPHSIPPSWLPVAQLPGRTSPWRPLRGTVYVAIPDAMPTGELWNACPAVTRWTLRDVIDVGDPQSEQRHQYVVDRPNWSGVRTLGDVDGPRRDDGRAFTGGQRFTTTRIRPGADACVAVRVDAGVHQQVSQWLANGHDIGITTTADLIANGSWTTKTLIVPATVASASTMTFEELFVSSSLDVNVFRIEVYQPAEDEISETRTPRR